MAGHGRDQQDARRVDGLVKVAAKTDQAAKRAAPNDLFRDRNFDAVNDRLGNAEAWLVVTPRGAFEDFANRSSAPPHRCVGQRIERIVEKLTITVCGRACRTDSRVAEFKPVVEHE